MRKSWILTLILITALVLRADEPFYGEMDLKMGSLMPVKYEIQQALVFRGVTVSIDSTAILQDTASVKVLYYPQLDKGENYVLRLIFGTETDSTIRFFDFMADLGKSIPDSIVWENEKGKVFLSYNGEPLPIPESSQQITGKIHLLKSKDEKTVTGDLDLRFLMPFSSDQLRPIPIEMKGIFDVPVGEYRSARLVSIDEKKKLRDKYRSNLYLGIAISLFIVAIFGFR